MRTHLMSSHVLHRKPCYTGSFSQVSTSSKLRNVSAEEKCLEPIHGNENFVGNGDRIGPISRPPCQKGHQAGQSGHSHDAAGTFQDGVPRAQLRHGTHKGVTERAIFAVIAVEIRRQILPLLIGDLDAGKFR